MNIQETIQKLHREMREEILDAGIQDTSYDHAIKEMEKKTEAELISLLAFFQRLKETLYQDLLVVRNYRPKEFWHNLKSLFSQHKLREQKLLAAEQRRIRKAWKGYFHVNAQPKASSVKDGTQEGAA